MKNIPEGFEKSNLVLNLLSKEDSDLVINKILKMIVRDFYVFYSIKDVFRATIEPQLYCISFYCRPKDDAQIAYRIGLLYQLLKKPYKSVKEIDNAIHSLPDNFPECIRIEQEKN